MAMDVFTSRNIVLWYLMCSIVVGNSIGKFIKIGPCVFRWGEECPDDHINFYLYTRKNIKKAQLVMPDSKSIQNSFFNPYVANKIIIHGYNSDMNLTQLLNIKEGYLATKAYNVWMVDWNEVAAAPCYPVVVSNINYVAKCIADLVKNIVQMSKLPTNKSSHVIGFSLGAHVAAYLANHLRPLKLPKITGLDPALPLFITKNKDQKLDRTDALFVDVIHTDALTEGQVEESGDVDFYMNGGVYQPGCWNGNLFDTTRCNHHRAPAYFAESIVSTVGFFGWSCSGFWQYLADGCPYAYPETVMGEYVDKNSKGYYIVRTAMQPPYAIGHNKTAENVWEQWTSRIVMIQKQSAIQLNSIFMPSQT